MSATVRGSGWPAGHAGHGVSPIPTEPLPSRALLLEVVERCPAAQCPCHRLRPSQRHLAMHRKAFRVRTNMSTAFAARPATRRNSPTAARTSKAISSVHGTATRYNHTPPSHVLFGLTRDTPDTTLRAQLEYEF